MAHSMFLAILLVVEQCLGSISGSVLDPSSILVDPDMNSDSISRGSKNYPQKRKNLKYLVLKTLWSARGFSSNLDIHFYIFKEK
jgi:hypothetical protein